MTSYQSNHKQIENAVQAKLGIVEIRLNKGSTSDRLKAWGEYLEKNKNQKLKLKDHSGLYELGKLARQQGMTDDIIDGWIKKGRNEFLRPRTIKEREEVIWKD